MKAPIALNLYVTQGADLALPFASMSLGGVPLAYGAGWLLRAEVRRRPQDPTPAAVFAVTITDAANFGFTLSLDDDVTALLPAGQYLYDLRVTAPNDAVFYPLIGTITVRAAVTQP